MVLSHQALRLDLLPFLFSPRFAARLRFVIVRDTSLFGAFRFIRITCSSLLRSRGSFRRLGNNNGWTSLLAVELLELSLN